MIKPKLKLTAVTNTELAPNGVVKLMHLKVVQRDLFMLFARLFNLGRRIKYVG